MPPSGRACFRSASASPWWRSPCRRHAGRTEPPARPPPARRPRRPPRRPRRTTARQRRDRPEPLGKRLGDGPGHAAPAAEAAPPAADWRAAAPSVLLFLAYIVLLEPLGYLPATTAFITLEARLLGSRRWGRDLLAALVVAFSVYALFSLLLGLRLPAGFLVGP